MKRKNSVAGKRQVTILTTPGERKVFDEAAASEGMATAAWARHLLFKEIQRRAIEEGRPIPAPGVPGKKQKRGRKVS